MSSEPNPLHRDLISGGLRVPFHWGVIVGFAAWVFSLADTGVAIVGAIVGWFLGCAILLVRLLRTLW